MKIPKWLSGIIPLILLALLVFLLSFALYLGTLYVLYSINS